MKLALEQFINGIEEILTSRGFHQTPLFFSTDDIPSGSVHRSYVIESFNVKPVYLANHISDYANGGTEAGVLILWQTRNNQFHQGFLELIREYQLIEDEILRNKSNEITINSAEINTFQQSKNHFFLILRINFLNELQRSENLS